MKYIIRYTKPFFVSVIIIIGLLFVQAICELNLPNYMSEIVNVGIQQSGIENSTPDAISEEGFDFITMFMSEEDKETTANSYTKENGDSLTEEYPSASGKNIYIKNEDADTENLDNIFSYASFAMINTLSAVSDSSLEMNEESMANFSMLDLYELKDFFLSLTDTTISDEIEKAKAADPMLTSQTSILITSSFYEELGIDLNEKRSDYIINVGVLMLIIAVLGGIATVSVSFFSARVSSGVATNLRSQIFSKINSFSSEEYDRFSTSSLITRSTNDITQIQMVLMMGLRFLFYSPIMIIGGIFMALTNSVSMVWVIALAGIVMLGFLMIIFASVLPKFKIIQKLIDKINLVSRETLNGLMVIKAFGTEKFEKERFEKANTDFAKTNLFINKAMSFMFPIIMLIMNATTILIVWVGSDQVANSGMMVGDIMAYIQYAMQIIMSFLMITMVFVFLPRAIVSATRIAEVLDTTPSISDPLNPTEPKKESRGVVEFKNVSFKYLGADESAVENISFIASPGKTTAFIGATGSGKSTLVNLIPRFYDATDGEVIVSGVNVKNMTQHALHEEIGYVPQKSVLMSGTIESNIKFGNMEADETTLEKAAEISQAKSFIESKDLKYQSHISQAGSNVSGGQRQRLSIARALATNANIFIFDDSFSALDYKTDAELRKSLKENTADATVIIVAQRVSTILNADTIHVMENGRIIGTGTHKELLKSCEAYYEIASTQLSKEELENE